MLLITTSAHLTGPRRHWRSTWRGTEPLPRSTSAASATTTFSETPSRSSAPRRRRPRPELRSASLGSKRRGGNGQALAAALKDNRQVVKINLSWNGVGDVGAQAWEVLAEFFVCCLFLKPLVAGCLQKMHLNRRELLSKGFGNFAF